MKLALAAAAALTILFGVIWLFGPREPVDGPLSFNPEVLGANLEGYLYHAERAYPDLTRGAQKHILWADPVTKARTDISIVYIHGFSATLHEIRPVPDLVAKALGANLFYTRLTGHGRSGIAMLEGNVPAWRNDVAEALEIGRRIGRKVIVMGASTGGTLSTLAVFDDRMNKDIAGVVLISPNFGMRESRAWALTLPYMREVLPKIVGPVRGFAPENAEHAKWWTTRYPTVSVIPVAAAAREAYRLPLGQTDVPALFIFSDSDQIVRSDRTREVADRWGGRVSVWPVEVGPRDDRMSHIVAGDILSPGMNEAVVERILEWVKERNLQD